MDNTFKFSKENFPSLVLGEYLKPLSTIGFQDLQPEEHHFFGLFVAYIAPSLIGQDAVDESQLLWVKAGDSGIFQDVYGPSIKADGDGGLVLQLGMNRFTVTLEDKELKCGMLSGGISFDEPMEVPRNDKKITFQPGFVDFLSEQAEILYRVKCSFNLDIDLKPSAIRFAQKTGDIKTLASYFKVIGSSEGHSDTLKMEELGEGEFLVTSWRTVETKYGLKFVLVLGDGREVWSRGNVQSVLASGYQKPSDKPCTLAIANIRPRSDGKFSVDCALRLREPKETKVLPAVDKKADQKVLAMAAAGKQPDLDDIPF